ncbi:hypothetical protein M407DRAFT_191924 [Tulasnella calospora MUT 4182]|uniref:Uncharacterized protein n=1 Tax=Tulasnella calospora MUT 4182 TaxID=1051891 RepID=A0A0C3QV46_9AGAM|nr:hypothetical protein M407DRAFT_191924 [Tulasnella calospora MUT 4182]
MLKAIILFTRRPKVYSKPVRRLQKRRELLFKGFGYDLAVPRCSYIREALADVVLGCYVPLYA